MREQYKNVFYVLLAACLSAFLIFWLITKDIGAALFPTMIVGIIALVYTLIIISGSADKTVQALGIEMIELTQSDNELNYMVSDLANKAGLDTTPRVGVVNQDIVNAVAIGATKDSLIIFYAGLLNNLSREEVQAIAAHEIAHIKSGDSVSKLGMFASLKAFSYVLLAPLYICAVALIPLIGTALLTFTTQVVSKVVHFTFAIFGTIITSAFSRQREYSADAEGAKLTSPETLIGALEKIDRLVTPPNQNDPYLSSISIVSKATSTHPGTIDRIQKLKQL